MFLCFYKCLLFSKNTEDTDELVSNSKKCFIAAFSSDAVTTRIGVGVFCICVLALSCAMGPISLMTLPKIHTCVCNALHYKEKNNHINF